MTQLRLSYTKLSFYLACPKRYYFRYIEKRPYYPNIRTRYGSNIHRAIKDYTEAIKEEGSLDFKNQAILYEKQWKDVTTDELKNLEFKDQGIEELQKFCKNNEKSLKDTIYYEKSFKYQLDNIT